MNGTGAFRWNRSISKCDVASGAMRPSSTWFSESRLASTRPVDEVALLGLGMS